ncbi:MAG: hypothetical protein J5614_09320 [Paludibacteraceae bacterium]|nr:hypothetical protein [Paludibacteraceae bacterium]
MPILKLNVGDGLGFDGNGKLTVKYTGANIHVVDVGNAGELGLYVDDLTGNPGSVCDTWSTIVGPGRQYDPPYGSINNFLDLNRNVVSLIFTYGAYQVGQRGVNGQNSISYTSTPKTVGDIIDEINKPLFFNGTNRTFYKPYKGEMIQLVDGPATALVNNTGSGTIAVERGDRLANNIQTTKALFVITDIQYKSDIQPGGSEYWVHSMKLVCIYSDLSTFTPREQTYDGTESTS